MKKYNGAVFFDYDGTLTDETEGIYSPTEKTLDAIKKLQDKGYFTCLCTGRSMCYAPECVSVFDGSINSNGSYLQSGGECLFSQPYSPHLAEELVEYMLGNNIYFFAETQELCYTDCLDKPYFTDMLKNFKIQTVYKPLKDIDINNIYKFVCTFESEESHKKMKEHFRGKVSVDLHRSYFSADVSVSNVTKGTGIKKITEILNIPYANTFAFGDGENDIEMFKAVRHPVALKVCFPELKKTAEFVTDTVKNEGIHKALVHYGII